jgi:hypothetical protein
MDQGSCILGKFLHDLDYEYVANAFMHSDRLCLFVWTSMSCIHWLVAS